MCLAALLLVADATYSGEAAEKRWVGSWAASQQLVEPSNALNQDDLRDSTLRQIVHLSLGGSEIRLRLSNRFGDAPLHLTAVHLARPVSANSDKIVPGSDKALTFSGSAEVTIPSHADYLSDPAAYPVNALSDLAITLRISAPSAQQTGHPGSRATSYLTHGVFVSAAELQAPKTVEHWYFIAGIDVTAPPDARAVIVLGDSITDGHGATTNGNDRWTDVLAQHLQGTAATRSGSGETGC